MLRLSNNKMDNKLPSVYNPEVQYNTGRDSSGSGYPQQHPSQRYGNPALQQAPQPQAPPPHQPHQHGGMSKYSGLVGGVFVLAVLVAVAVIIGISLQKIDSYEVGLKYDTIWKKLSEEPSNEGLYIGNPGFKFVRFPSVFKSIDFEKLLCLNKDGVNIELRVSYQYRARPNKLYNIATQFKDHGSYLRLIESAGKAAILEACSHFNTSQFQAERGSFQELVGENLINRYNDYDCDVSEIQVRNIQRPGAYEKAVKEKEAARENIKVAENERPRKITKATTAKREAEGQAEITIAQAQSRARIVTNRANLDAEAILDQFEREAETYEILFKPANQNGLSLTKEGFLSYMGIRAISNAKQTVQLGMDAPAKTSYKSEL